MSWISLFIILTIESLANAQWNLLLSNGGPYGSTDVGETTFNDYFHNSNGIILRSCSNCDTTHSIIYYKRISGDITSFNPYNYMKCDWASSNNLLGTNFNLYSNYDDAINNVNAWTTCNYDSTGVGAFRDCGPTGLVSWQWVSFCGVAGSTTVGFYIQSTSWIPLLSNGGPYGTLDVGATSFNTYFQNSNGIILRNCSDCASTHSIIYYKRISGDISSFQPYSYMKCQWFSSNNILGTNFNLYSDYDDAINNANAWTTCDYDDPTGVGAFRDCGPTGLVDWQWVSFCGVTGSKTVAFYILSP